MPGKSYSGGGKQEEPNTQPNIQDVVFHPQATLEAEESEQQYLSSFILNSDSYKKVQTPHSARPLARMLVVILLIIAACLFFVPWQQTVIGYGKVTVFSPMSRPQLIEAPILGRLQQWFVMEGQDVKKGQPIAKLVDLDSKFLDQDQIPRLMSQVNALKERKKAAEDRMLALMGQRSNLGTSRMVAIPAAFQKMEQAQDRYRAAEQALQAAKQNLTTAELNRKRLEDLYEKGLRSQRDRELAELDYIRAKTDVQRAEAALEVAFKDKTISSLDKAKVEADTSATLDGLSASIASAQETIASTNSDILKLEIDLSNLKGRTNQRVIVAPMDGRIVRLLKLGAGETVDSGENLATLVPKTLDQAVEIYVNDNDIPLVSIGDHVRLQFAGWPALQFTGWPSVAVGTFPGKVKVIDMVDDGKKRYRVLVRPDWETVKTHKDEHWPSPEHLRPGGAVVGWILISSKPMFGMPRGTVPLGYELWRQFNGFPPTVERDAIKTDSDYTTDATSGINEKKDDGKGTKRKAKSK